MTSRERLGHIVWRRVGDTTVVLNLQTETYLALSATGTRLWTLYQQHGLRDAARIASREYGIPEPLAREDLAALLWQIRSAHARPTRWRFSLNRLGELRALGRVSARMWPALISTALVATAVEIGLHTLKVPRLAALLGVRVSFDGVAPGAARSSVPTAREQRTLWSTDRVLGRWPFGDTCLRRALVLGFHLRRRRPVLRIGVAAPEGAPIAAHAWIEAGTLTLLASPGFKSLTHEALEVAD